MSRTRRSLFNYASLLLLNAASLVLGFVVTPAIIEHIGSDRFGAFRTLVEWVSYLPLLTLGLDGGTRTFFGQHQSDSVKTLQGLRMAIKYFVMATVLIVFAAVALAFTSHILMNTPAEMKSEVRWATFIMSGSVALYPLLPFQYLIEARQKNYLINLSFTLQRFLIAGLSLLFAIQGLGLEGQSLAFLLGVTPIALLFVYLSGREIPGLWRQLLSRRMDHELRRELSHFNRHSLMINLSGRLSLASDNILISFFLGPKAVAVFFLSQRLLNLARDQLLGVGNSSWAALAELHKNGERATLRERSLELTSLVAGLSAILLPPLCLYNQAFISLWVGEELSAGHVFFALTALLAAVVPIIGLWLWIFHALGQVRFAARASSIAAAINVLCSVAFTHQLGLTGPILGSLCGYLGYKFWACLWELHRQLEISPRQVVKNLWRPALIAVSTTTLLLLTEGPSRIDSWSHWLLHLVLCLAWGTGIYWLTASRQEKQRWAQRLGRLF